MRHTALDRDEEITRSPAQAAGWRGAVGAENQAHVLIGGHNYMLSADGLLMPPRGTSRRPICGISTRPGGTASLALDPRMFTTCPILRFYCNELPESAGEP